VLIIYLKRLKLCQNYRSFFRLVDCFFRVLCKKSDVLAIICPALFLTDFIPTEINGTTRSLIKYTAGVEVYIGSGKSCRFVISFNKTDTDF